MLRRLQGLWLGAFAACDIALSLGLFCLAYVLRFQPVVTSWLPAQPPLPPAAVYLRVLPVLALVLLVANRTQGLYTPRREGSLPAEALDILKATALAVVAFAAILFFERTYSYARGIIAIFAVLNPFGAILLRAAIRSALRIARRRGYNLRHVLIVGTGRSAQALIHRIRRNSWTGFRILGLIGDRPRQEGRMLHGTPVLGTTAELERIIDERRPDQVFIALGPERTGEMGGLVRILSEKLVGIRIVPHLGSLLGMDCRTDDFDGIPIVSLWEEPIGGWNALLKRFMDFTLALAALAVSSPVLILIAILVKATSPGPIFFRQPRMGLDGRLFRIIKFRTMRQDLEQGDDGAWTRPGDLRRTPLGRILRRTSLDELPQLLNVLAGQMSLVGPRPERPVFIEKFKKTIPRYMLRHRIKAGITGWAQVNGWRGDTSLKKRIQHDLYYLEHWSLGFDLKILFLTLLRGLIHPNAY